jgi:four helix bundle protein
LSNILSLEKSVNICYDFETIQRIDKYFINQMTDFREIKEWEKAHELTVAVYQATQEFPEVEILGLTQQIRLACSAIPIKIAQGYDREDYEEKINYLELASDNATEVQYFLLLSYELQMLPIEDYDRLVSKAVEVREAIDKLITKFNNKF